MTALDATAVRKGHTAMEKAISTAARVRRQLKAGRPRAVRDVPGLNNFTAMGILANQAAQGRGDDAIGGA